MLLTPPFLSTLIMGLTPSSPADFSFTEESVDGFVLIESNPLAIVPYKKPAAPGQLVSLETQANIKHFLECSGVALANVAICATSLAAAGGFFVAGALLVPNMAGSSVAIFFLHPELFALLTAPAALSMTIAFECIKTACDSNNYLSYPEKPQLALEYKKK